MAADSEVLAARKYLEFVYRAHRSTLDSLTKVFNDGIADRNFTPERDAEINNLRERLLAIDVQVHLANARLQAAEETDRQRAAAFWAKEEADREARRARKHAEKDALKKKRQEKVTPKVVSAPPREAEPSQPRQRVWIRSGQSSTDELDKPELPVPVTLLLKKEGGDVHNFPDDIERRAVAMWRWTPGARRQRSRRYEGFSRRGELNG